MAIDQHTNKCVSFLFSYLYFVLTIGSYVRESTAFPILLQNDKCHDASFQCCWRAFILHLLAEKNLIMITVYPKLFVQPLSRELSE